MGSIKILGKSVINNIARKQRKHCYFGLFVCMAAAAEVYGGELNSFWANEVFYTRALRSI